jgi:3-oxoacyl-[acyl-carrier-protein] synthase-3
VGTGAFVPGRRLTNEEIESSTPGTNARWTYEKLGIRERRIAGPDESTGDLAVEAGRRAIADAGLGPGDIDLIIVCTTTPRRVAPSTACYVQHELGARNCPAFDLAAVCSGFIYGLGVGSQFISAGIYRHVLVIGADTFSKITDWTRRDCVFFGDGAGAVVLGACPAGEGILAIDLGADGSEHDAWTVLGGGSETPTTRESVEKGLHFWEMDGKAVYDMAIERIPWTLGRSLRSAGLTVRDIDHVIPHQPSLQILKRSAELIGVPFERFHVNMDRYANTSAATIPLVLHEAREAGRIQPGQVLAFIAVGAGWTWGSVIMRWAV